MIDLAAGNDESGCRPSLDTDPGALVKCNPVRATPACSRVSCSVTAAAAPLASPPRVSSTKVA